jgi:hypothetical protein
MTYFYLIYREIDVFLCFFEFISPRKAILDMMLSTLKNEPTERMLPKEPIDPIENAEPLEPMLIKELCDHRLNTELVEPLLKMELLSIAMSPP